MWVTREVTLRSAEPIRRVVEHVSPTAEGPPLSMQPLTTPSCHSANRAGSVA